MPTISTKFTPTGDKEYRNAIKEINSGLSVLRSEMKKASAEYALNEDATEGLAQQNDILDRTILSLSDKLEVQREQWARLVQQYGEADVRSQRLATAINETTAEMYKAQYAIAKNDEAIEEYRKETDKAKESSGTLLEAVGNLAGKFGIDLPDGLGTSLGALGDMDAGMAGLAGVMATVAAQIAKLVADTAEYTQELSKQSDITGLSTQSLQQLDDIAVSVGADYDQLIDGTKDLTQRVNEAAEGNEELADTFRALRVPIKETNGELRPMDEIYWDVIYALANMEEGVKRDALAMDLMGESARELNPMLALSADEIDQFRAAAETMSDQTIENVNRMNRETKKALKDIRDSFRAGIGEIADWLSGDLNAGDMKWSLAVQSGLISRNAGGTDNWRGGITWVGENGPELVSLPQGSQIHNAQESREMAGGGNVFNVTINAKDIKELNDIVRIAESSRMSQRMGYTGRK